MPFNPEAKLASALDPKSDQVNELRISMKSKIEDLLGRVVDDVVTVSLASSRTSPFPVRLAHSSPHTPRRSILLKCC